VRAPVEAGCARTLGVVVERWWRSAMAGKPALDRRGRHDELQK
jgi:hypothetical protein